MTYEKTARLVNAINQLETWTRSLARKNGIDGGVDHDDIKRTEKWAAEARQEIFDLVAE
jgi:hypothetical protein